MSQSSLYLFAADVALSAHILFVGFVVGSLVLIVLGHTLDWSWIRNPLFRVLHLAAIGIVVIQAWFGIVCPLTTLEMAFRVRAGDASYSGTFISHWLQTLLYYEAPQWIFVTAYTVFATLVLISWYVVPPRRWRKTTRRT